MWCVLYHSLQECLHIFYLTDNMPKPKAGETRKDFMMRCIPEVIKEGKKRDQAIAICSSCYEKKDT